MGFLNFLIVVQLLSRVRHIVPCGLQHARLPFPLLAPRVLKMMSIESVMLSNHYLLCRRILLPSVFPSIRVFSSEAALHIRWPKYWSFSISPSNEHPGLIWVDGLVGSPCSPRDSQESSPTPQFKSISSSVLSLLYGLTLTSIHDYCKNPSFD